MLLSFGFIPWNPRSFCIFLKMPISMCTQRDDSRLFVFLTRSLVRIVGKGGLLSTDHFNAVHWEERVGWCSHLFLSHWEILGSLLWFTYGTPMWLSANRATVMVRFAKEAGLSIPTTFHVWKLSHDVLDHIKGKVLCYDDTANYEPTCTSNCDFSYA